MRIRRVEIKNFRKIEDISLSLPHDIAVIVGPNAMGKTSVLEAIRLCKSVLIPRTNDEVQLVLVSLGAATAHIMFGQFQYDFSNLAGDISKPVLVSLEIDLSAEELSGLSASEDQIAQRVVAGRMGLGAAHAQMALIQFLSSPAGQQAIAAERRNVRSRIAQLAESKSLGLSLVITNNQINGQNELDQAIGATLETLLPPARALFTYFPADRSLPAGEVNVQLHSGDMKAHVDSHFSNAASKYPRLKQVIVSNLIANGSEQLANEFKLIFGKLLPGKHFKSLQQKPTGVISVRIRDDNGSEFDIDGMSSGEKGLILTYLLLRSSIAQGGIALIDEPELHLNPSVCRRLLDFLDEHVCKALDAQIILCTHSPEILTQAFERDEVSLHELLSPTMLNPLYREDREELYEALLRLGVSTAESLVSKGFIFVEGEDDIRIYEAGFPDLLQGYKVAQKQGRTEILKSIEEFKKLDAAGKLQKPHIFIFDHDDKPLKIDGTTWVKVIQLKRYCIENYLLSDRDLYNCIKHFQPDATLTRADVAADLKSFSIDQLRQRVIIDAFGDLQDLSCGIRQKKIRDASYDEAAIELKAQLLDVLEKLQSLNIEKWSAEFAATCEAREKLLRATFEPNYLLRASGKLILESFQRKYKINHPQARIKLDLVGRVAAGNGTEWKELRQLLSSALG